MKHICIYIFFFENIISIDQYYPIHTATAYLVYSQEENIFVPRATLPLKINFAVYLSDLSDLYSLRPFTTY